MFGISIVFCWVLWCGLVVFLLVAQLVGLNCGATLFLSGFFLLAFWLFFVRVVGASVECGYLLFVLLLSCVFVFLLFWSCLSLLFSLVESLGRFLIYIYTDLPYFTLETKFRVPS